jgi:hypothetical protein
MAGFAVTTEVVGLHCHAVSYTLISLSLIEISVSILALTIEEDGTTLTPRLPISKALS